MYNIWEIADEVGFPRHLLKIEISIFTCVRSVAVSGVTSSRSGSTYSAVVAGSTAGTRALKMVVIR
eukprot:6846794-Pyramimonas_sp.AAC.1